MKRIGTLVLAAALCAAAFTAGTAYGGAAEGSWFISPQVNALWLDDGRVADDDAGVTLGFGLRDEREVGCRILACSGRNTSAPATTSLELQGFGLSLNRVFYREGRVNPFLSLGIAQTKSILKPGCRRRLESALYGGGLLITLGAERDDGSIMQLRADLGARRALTDRHDR